MRLFELHRIEDATGINGTGVVAQGVEFDDGACAMRWLTEHTSTAFYGDVATLEKIHGHGGKTIVVWTPDVFCRGRTDAVQDAYENCPFASIGGMTRRADMVVPNYIGGGDGPDYLRGYRAGCDAVFGKGWETAQFGWTPAITINATSETPPDVGGAEEYPHAFERRDALAFGVAELRAFDFIWASPPCQAFTAYKRRTDHVRPALNLIPQARELLRAAGVPYAIENVPGAPLEDPVTLCGSMFGLDVRRHRIFETSFPVTAPPCNHGSQAPGRFPGATNRAKNSRATVEVGVYRIPLATQRAAMGVDRAVSLHKLSQMVPPAFAEFLGLQARAHIMTTRRAA